MARCAMLSSMTVFACLAVWLGALIFPIPKAEASLAHPYNLSTKRFQTIPPEIRPVGRPRPIPARLKREKPGEKPVGPPVRRGKGLAQSAPRSEDLRSARRR